MRIDRKFTLAKAERAELLIQGKILKQGIPISCMVRAYNRSTGQLLNETTSKSNGNYILLGVRNGSNYIIALDPKKEYNIVAQDNVK